MTRKTRTNESQQTAEQLLDAAERLFSQHGYDGVGMRALAQEARVNLGAATYHFGSKEELYIETFMRRFRAINAERARLLREAEAQAQGGVLTVETIVDYLIRPTYLMGLAYPGFYAMLARTLLTPPPFLESVLSREYEPSMTVFQRALQRALPDMSPGVIVLRVALSMGALLMFLVQLGKMDAARNPRLDESVLKELVRFVSAGLSSEPATTLANRAVFSFRSKRPRK